MSCSHADSEQCFWDDFRKTMLQRCETLEAAMYYVPRFIFCDQIWMEFIFTKLCMPSTEIEKYSISTLSTNNKFKMLETWAKIEEQKSGAKPTVEKFVDIFVTFMQQRNAFPFMLQQNFNGPINAGTFNAFVRNTPTEQV